MNKEKFLKQLKQSKILDKPDVTIYVHKKHPDAVIPEVAYEGTSAAFDITCIEDTVIPAKGKAIVPNGLNITIDQNDPYYMEAALRSSWGFKKDLSVFPGIFDGGYTGNFGVKVYNFSNESITIKKGERYAQIKVMKKPKFQFVELKDKEWDEFKKRQIRGDKGFGSSGK